MPKPHYIKVPRGEDPSPDMKQQPAHLSEHMKNWLQEGPKDTPWHNIDSIEPESDTQGKFEVNVAPSETPATQGTNLILVDIIPKVDMGAWFATLDIGSSLDPISMATTYAKTGVRRGTRLSVLFPEINKVIWGSKQSSKKSRTLHVSRGA
ncbi:uncharacterized protein FSUBG_2298 [Fusarium subglutinans]|uniref:Uncharacterized protein n=1 Tax=Gibberella subglutinans TaxID=42677 RepID=A0A8H5V7B8_GIBSU|nr:uncharacterized protein FSUBG_2298 [Fusarium subglutinans]KAF5611465.1 hypothetical protein FSUBG_2298 [Fusarium subglutinans]